MPCLVALVNFEEFYLFSLVYIAVRCINTGNVVMIESVCWNKPNYGNNTHTDGIRINIMYEGHLESKERFAIKKYFLIIGKKKNMQVLSHTFTYFST